MQVRIACTNAISKGLDDIHGLGSFNKQVAGLGFFDDAGRFRYTDKLWNEIQRLDLTKFSSS